jgi:Family of unknown function (DUF6361)
MLDIVDLFREHDTRDELGIGSVRDTFADLFFPGTSTIMTRARYFLIVPWIYQRLEKQRISSPQIAERGRRTETDLIDAIERSDDSEGNIGTLAGHALKRLPSNIYWQGLGVWGIRAFQGSQAQYHRGLDGHYVQLTRHGARLSERDNENDDLVTPNWHGGLITPPSNFPKECTLRLTHREAEYLGERIRLSPISSGSLLAALISQGRRSGNALLSGNIPTLRHCPQICANSSTTLRTPLRSCTAHNCSTIWFWPNRHNARTMLRNIVKALRSGRSCWLDVLGSSLHGIEKVSGS